MKYLINTIINAEYQCLKPFYYVKQIINIEQNYVEHSTCFQTFFVWAFNIFIDSWNAPIHNSILVTDYLSKIGIKIVPQPPYSPDLAPCDFCLFPKLRGCRYERIEEIKEAVTKVIDTLTQVDFHGALQKLFERYKCIAVGGDYFEGD